jgi:hypothetical protein
MRKSILTNMISEMGLLGTVCVPELGAQSFTATVSGTISDPSAASAKLEMGATGSEIYGACRK